MGRRLGKRAFRGRLYLEAKGRPTVAVYTTGGGDAFDLELGTLEPPSPNVRQAQSFLRAGEA